MIRTISISLFLCFFNIDKVHCQDRSEIKDTDIYVFINDCLIPYFSEIGDTNIKIASSILTTEEILYYDAIDFLKNDLALDKKNIQFMKQQIREITNNIKWEQNKISGAILLDSLKSYEGHFLSKPIFSIDKNIFIIIKYVNPKPEGWCATVMDYYLPMLFMKVDNKWALIRTFDDMRINNNR